MAIVFLPVRTGSPVQILIRSALGPKGLFSAIKIADRWRSPAPPISLEQAKQLFGEPCKEELRIHAAVNSAIYELWPEVKAVAEAEQERLNTEREANPNFRTW